MESVSSRGIFYRGRMYTWDRIGGVSYLNAGFHKSSFNLYDTNENILTTIEGDPKNIRELHGVITGYINKPDMMEFEPSLEFKYEEMRSIANSLKEENERLVAENSRLKRQLRDAFSQRY